MKVAVVQTDPVLGAVAENRKNILAGITSVDADLVVFPECAVTGYGLDSREEALGIAETVPGPTTEAVEDLCRDTDKHVILGVLESDGDFLYNSAILVGREGLVGRYRKMHLPFLGVDRFVQPGNLGFPVFEIPGAKIGILICYDLSFPEAPRALKLAGAQVICVVTNWPQEAEVSCVHSPPVRAQENHVNLVIADRAGQESGFTFRGMSRIVDVEGRTLAQAGRETEIIQADVDPGAADESKVVIFPDRYELDRIRHRRPEHYGSLTDQQGDP